MIDLKDFIEAIKESKPKTSAYDTTATVRRVEGNTAWVHIPGGMDETPVKMTVNAQAGDTVQVRVSGGSAFIVGNATAPPTDDTKAIKVEQKVGIVERVVTAVKEVAESTAKIAGNTRQYFWFTSEGTDTGAHITEVPQDEFLADPQNGGGNLLARSNGIAVRDGTTELATFSANASQIGAANSTNINLTSTSSQSTMSINAGSAYTPVKIVGKSSVGYIHIDNDEIAIIGGHSSTYGGVNIDSLGILSYGTNNSRHAQIDIQAFGINRNVSILLSDMTGISLSAGSNVYMQMNDTTGITFSANDMRVTGQGRLIPQTDSSTWTAPTVVSNQATIRQGGYYEEGKHTYVQMEIRLASSLAEDTTLSGFLSGFPVPENTLAILSIATGGGGWGWAAVNTYGEMNIRLNKQTGTSTNIYITGVYTTA